MGALHSLPAHPPITSPPTLQLAITQLRHGCCILQLQFLLGNSSSTGSRSRVLVAVLFNKTSLAGASV
jgi:hypothetical protein